MSNNVIEFPGLYEGPPRDFEEVKQNLDLMKYYHIQETIATLAPMIFNQLDLAGFEFSEDEADVKDGAFVIEAVRSIMCKHYGLYHPFQRVSEEVFNADEDEPGSLKIADSLCLDLKKLETA
jgi:hypothetical protein